jgi:hypothetical protein
MVPISHGQKFTRDLQKNLQGRFCVSISLPRSELATMTEAQQRKERRERRILTQSDSRLERIANLQGPAAAQELLWTATPSPCLSCSPSLALNLTSQETSHAPGRDINGTHQPISMSMTSEGLMNGSGLEDNPLMNLFKHPLVSQFLGQNSTGEGQATSSSSPDNLTRLVQTISQQLFAKNTTEQQPEQDRPPPQNTSEWKWKFARIVIVFTILTYISSQLEDYHFSRNIDPTYGFVTPFYSAN